MSDDQLKVGFAQIAPVWLQRQATIDKMLSYIQQAGEQGCQLLTFGETLLPGYPFWLDFTDGARFNSALQKEMHAHYLEEAIQIERGDLAAFCQAARAYQMALLFGIVERPADRGGHSVYCSLVYITPQGEVANVHRKLQPTYEERLSWSPGDGHGLRTFPLGKFTLGGLNCWENWMPLPRAALYGLGEDLHVAIWPGNVRNTDILTRFLAREGRSYVISVSGLMRKSDIPSLIPHYDLVHDKAPEWMADGGSCIAHPDGSWLLEPITKEECLRVVSIDHRSVREERQNFDPAGHYSRPDVTQLHVNRQRQSTLSFEE
ncbi:carbon-nitrogen hydrolase family protein [Lewinella sp. LCG006]|uniref:carbon-nitrogen hydrolase family protein n=1 Tax=Lewinella sp. LCG006 TaxID=3231911 RepID=UPI0034603CA1